MQERVYVLSNGKILEAFASSRKEISRWKPGPCKNFHYWFFTLDPDDKLIRENITKALYLADVSAKRQYDNLEEKGYYAQIISGNVSQTIKVDSVRVDTGNHPYGFRCYARRSLSEGPALSPGAWSLKGYYVIYPGVITTRTGF